MGYGLMTRFIAHFDRARDYNLEVTIMHTTNNLVSTVTPSLSLLGSRAQLRPFPFVWISEL
jgi:hypothetical protein